MLMGIDSGLGEPRVVIVTHSDSKDFRTARNFGWLRPTYRAQYAARSWRSVIKCRILTLGNLLVN